MNWEREFCMGENVMMYIVGVKPKFIAKQEWKINMLVIIVVIY